MENILEVIMKQNKKKSKGDKKLNFNYKRLKIN